MVISDVSGLFEILQNRAQIATKFSIVIATSLVVGPCAVASLEYRVEVTPLDRKWSRNFFVIVNDRDKTNTYVTSVQIYRVLQKLRRSLLSLIATSL